MDGKNKTLLQHYQHDIVKDLDVMYIIDELYSKEAINSYDFDHITCKLTDRAERTRYLIEILISTGSNQSYENFVDSLMKDHKWLWEKFAIDMNKSVFNDSYEDSLSRGDVPRLPNHYVQRISLEQDVSEKLNQLTRHKKLVLHGMLGSGKTSVAIGVLRNNPDLITDNFNGVVFWLNLGTVKTDDDIVAQLQKLQRKASTMFMPRGSSYMNSSISMSSIGSNADSSLLGYDLTWQELKDQLKNVFSDAMLKEALIVLDEVNDKKCVEAFDVGCKMLITTRDTGVVMDFQPQIVEIKNSLEESESLKLFASCLDIEVSQLPRQAHKLHEICKGHPFHIALIAAQFTGNKERLVHDHKYWNYYVDKLAKKDFFFITRHSDNPMKPIEMCIKLLPPEISTLFKKLAILPDNVKVSVKVLTKLWQKDVLDVESIMKLLRSKSLIMEYYDYDKRDYFYEVHDIIMSYLRKTVPEDEIKKINVEFLKAYKYDTLENSPVEIIDDTYIAFHIGHHLYNTKNLYNKWSLFQLFLDLRFLGNKVRLTGPADAIMDLGNYETLIAHNEVDREFLRVTREFLSTHGHDLHRYVYTDIVQSILQHEAKGILYTKASQVAQDNCGKNELYFEFLHEQDADAVRHSTIDVKESISSVSFLADYVLVGTTKGLIKVFHVYTNKLKKEFPSAGDTIKWVSACPHNKYLVAALTSDGTIRMWFIDEMELVEDLLENAIEEESEDSTTDNYGKSFTIPPKLGAFINCRWMNHGEILISHTSKMIALFGDDGKVHKLIDNFDRDRQIVCCIPSNDDKHVITSSIANGIFYVDFIDLITKDIVLSFEETVPALNLLTVPGSNRLLVLNEYEVIEHDYKIHNHTQYSTYKTKSILTTNQVTNNITFISAAVNKTGTLLFISTDDSRIICLDLKTNKYVFDLENRRGNVVSMAVSEVWYDDFIPGSDVLLTGTDSTEDSVKVWYLDASYVSQATQKHRKVRLTTKFDVSFLNTMTPQTPYSNTPPLPDQMNNTMPKRIQSFVNHKEIEKRVVKKTLSLDRHALKPLNLKGICNGNDEGSINPLLAVIDDKNNIQIMRGRVVLSEIPAKNDDKITTVKISPCNHYVIFGHHSGTVKKYVIRTKETKEIMDLYSPVQYLKFVNPNLLVVAGKNRCLMAYRLMFEGDWKLEMLQQGNTHLGSQEILNGPKKKNAQPDTMSQSDSDASIASKERLFRSDTKPSLCKGSCLVECFWIPQQGMITVENNASIKLWNEELQLVCVLHGRQTDVYVNCATFQKYMLVICDDYGKFQTFELQDQGEMKLKKKDENKFNSKILSCDLTSDGHILAMGLDSGDIVLWNVPGRCQQYFLRHHKSKVHTCIFSPVPTKLNRTNSATASPITLGQGFNFERSPPPEDDQPHLVLVTMASEIVWWDVTVLINKKKKSRIGPNVLSPVLTPIENRTQLTGAIGNLSITPNNLIAKPNNNFFFGDHDSNAHECWEQIWKKKICKQGSKRKEILACIKLSGLNARLLHHDDKFSCFVTVDNTGHIHIMNIMKHHNS